MEQYLAPVLGFIGTGLSAVILALFKKFASQTQVQIAKVVGTLEANNKATFVILQDRILQSCKYHQSVGYIAAHDAEMLEDLADQYYAMDGNGYVKKQVEATLSLPQEK